MSQFYDGGVTWSSSWSQVPPTSGAASSLHLLQQQPQSDASYSHAQAAAFGGWSTSWGDMLTGPGDATRVLLRKDALLASAPSPTSTSAALGAPFGKQSASANTAATHAYTTKTSATTGGFSSTAAGASDLTPTSELPASGYYEILPGQSWDAVVPTALPTKPAYTGSAAANAPNAPKPISKPIPTATAPVWVEVTSAEGWTASTQQGAPLTPTKSRQKSADANAAALGPQPGSPSSPNAPGSHTKRHQDIEDELGHQDRYKTELCRSWHESGTCRYGSKCQFAHGVQELRPVMRHPKYKTEPCRSWVETRSCPYGRRCRFIHADFPPIHHNAAIVPSNSMSNLANMNSMAGINGMANGGALNLSASAHSASIPISTGLNGGLSSQSMMSSMHQQQHHQPQFSVHPMQRSHSMSQPPTQQYVQQSYGSSQMHPSQHHGQQQQTYMYPSEATRAIPQFHNSGNMYPVPSHYAHLQQQQQAQQAQHYGYSQMAAMFAPSSPSFGVSSTSSSSAGLYHLFNSGSGSPPMSVDARSESIAAAKAANAPWLYDTFQDDEADDDELFSDSLPIAPLIEQLNLHAEPILSDTPSATSASATALKPNAISRPAPIGSGSSRAPSASDFSSFSTSGTSNVSATSFTTVPETSPTTSSSAAAASIAPSNSNMNNGSVSDNDANAKSKKKKKGFFKRLGAK